MKKLLSLSFVVLVLFAFSACNSPKETVPEKVKASFQKRFPKAKQVKWDKENKNEWEAGFEMNNREFSANFNVDGIWKKTEYKIQKSEIPPLVKATIDSLFTGYEIEEAAVIGNSEMKGFEIELKNEKGSMIATISRDGKVLEKRSADKKPGKGDSKEDKD
ncbi:MAG: hypothetical protein DRJ09_10660 [Bacteroidetes bacterium]|nr:MAG: hypothetical protein DRJ09_10660 [Bacteroidota bacterium]